jgi:hypothetical protein
VIGLNSGPPSLSHRLARAVGHQGEAGVTLEVAVTPLAPSDPPPRCTPDRPPPSCPGRPWSPARGAPASPPPLRQAPFTRPPLPAPGGKPGDGTPTPPVSIWTVRKFFQKIIPGKIPPGDGTRRQHFIYGRLAGPYCRRFKHFTAPLGLPMDAPFCGPRWGCGGPQRRRFIFPSRGEVLGRISWCWCPRGARSGRNGEDAIPGRFFPACCFWHQPYLQGFCYTNDREKLARERLLAS